jgi:hypothetical protein
MFSTKAEYNTKRLVFYSNILVFPNCMALVKSETGVSRDTTESVCGSCFIKKIITKVCKDLRIIQRSNRYFVEISIRPYVTRKLKYVSVESRV